MVYIVKYNPLERIRIIITMIILVLWTFFIIIVKHIVAIDINCFIAQVLDNFSTILFGSYIFVFIVSEIKQRSFTDIIAKKLFSISGIVITFQALKIFR